MSVTAILTAIGVFFVTDTDDLVVLLLLWLAAKHRQQRQQIIAGQYLGILSLIAIAWLVSRGVLHYDAAHLTHWLGLVPLTLGLVGLWQWWRGRHGPIATPRLAQSVSLPLVWSMTIGNGGDNLSIYIPYFTKLSPAAFGGVLVIFLVLIGIWLGVSYYLARSHTTTRFFERFGTWLSPLLFITIGLLILL